MKYYANVKMTITRQIEFETDISLSQEKLEELAIDQIEKEYGEIGLDDDVEIEELDYWLPYRKTMSK